MRVRTQQRGERVRVRTQQRRYNVAFAFVMIVLFALALRFLRCVRPIMWDVPPAIPPCLRLCVASHGRGRAAAQASHDWGWRVPTLLLAWRVCQFCADVCARELQEAVDFATCCGAPTQSSARIYLSIRDFVSGSRLGPPSSVGLRERSLRPRRTLMSIDTLLRLIVGHIPTMFCKKHRPRPALSERRTARFRRRSQRRWPW